MLIRSLAGLLLVVFCVSEAAAQSVDRVRVFKAERRLELLSGDRVLRDYGIALGANPVGHKRRQGDERTPEGRYLLDWRNPNSIAYRSMHISYPNEQDRRFAATGGFSPGGDIMIHGQMNGYGWLSWLTQWFDWTDGCIAVHDADMAEIWDMVADGTPIDIHP